MDYNEEGRDDVILYQSGHRGEEDRSQSVLDGLEDVLLDIDSRVEEVIT